MSDFESVLALTADTTGLEAGEKSFDDLAKSAERMEDRLAKALDAASRAMTQASSVMEKSTAESSKAMNAAAAAMDKMSDTARKASGDVAKSVDDQARSFSQLRAAIDPVYASSQRYAAMVDEVTAAAKREGVAEQDLLRILGMVEQRYLATGDAAEQYRREVNGLQASMDPLFAATQRLENAQEMLNNAYKAGAIGPQRLAEMQRQVQAQYTRTVDRINGVNDAQEKADKSGRQLGGTFVNTGYQIQDFSVQVMGGQNALMALTQQLPQILGGIQGVSTKMMIFASVAGTAVAVLGAVGMAYLASRKKAEDLEKQVDALNDAFDKYQASADIANLSTQALSERFGVGAKEVREFYAALMDLDAAALDTKFKALQDRLDDLTSTTLREKLFEKPGGDFSNTFGILPREAVDELREYTELVEKLSKAEGPKAQLAAVNELMSKVTELAEADGERSDREQEIIDNLRAQGEIYTQMIEKGEDLASEEADRLQKIQDQLSAYSNQTELQNAIATYGKDSAEAEQAKMNAALDAADAFIRQSGASGETAGQIYIGAVNAQTAANNADSAAAALQRAEQAARTLASAMAAAAGFSAGLENRVEQLNAQIEAARKGQNAANAGQIVALKQEAAARRDAILAGEATDEQRAAAEEAYQRDIQNADVIAGQLQTLEGINEANRASAKSSKASASEAKKLAKELEKDAEAWIKRIQTPAEKAQKDLNELMDLYEAGKLNADQFARAQSMVNKELADSNPLIGDVKDAWADFMLSGFRDYENFADAIWGSFKTLLKNMVTGAGNTNLQFGGGGFSLGSLLGIGTGNAGGIAGATGSGGGIGGFLSNQGLSWLSKSFSFGQSVWAGITAPLQAAMSAASSNGLMAGFKAYNASLNGMASGFNGLGMQIGAYAGPAAAGMYAGNLISGGYSIGSGKYNSTIVNGIGTAVGAALLGPIGGLIGGAVGGLANRLFGRKLSGTGIEGRFSAEDGFTGNSYQKYKGGWFSSDKTKRKGLDSSVTTTLSDSFNAVYDSVKNMSDVLDVAAGTFDKFSYSFSFSTKGKSDEEITEKFQAKLEEAGEKLAEMALGTDEYTKAGETSMETLTRLSQSLTAVETIVDTLGHKFDQTGLAGAALASDLADLFGGIDAMSSATQTYYNTFYTEEERRKTLLRQMTEQLAKINVTMPKTRDEYKMLIEAQDLSTKKGQEVYAALMLLASGMDSVLPSISRYTEEIAQLVDGTNSIIGSMVTDATAAANASATAAAAWYTVSENISKYLRDLDNSQLTRLDIFQQFSANQAYYEDLLKKTMGGDQAAAANLTTAAQDLLESAKGTASTSVDYARQVAKIQQDLKLAAGVADLEGGNEEAMQALYEQQVKLLEEIAASLAAGTIDEEALTGYQGSLDQLAKAIDQLQEFSYESMKEKLQVSVDLIARADLPADVKKLMEKAGQDIKTNIDFVLRSDLDPDSKWLAMQGSSEMVKTIDYVANTKGLTANLQTLALKSSEAINKTINLLTGSKLDKETLNVALAGSSELARVVNVTLSSGSSETAMKLALANAGKYAVTVSAALSDLDPTVRKLVATGSGTYAANIEAAITSKLGEAEKRILLLKQGTYTAYIQASLSLPPLASQLLEKSSSRFDIAIASAWIHLTPEQKKVLAQDGTDFSVFLGTAWKGLTGTQRKVLEDQFGDYTTNIGAKFQKGIGTNEWRVVGGAAERGFTAVISGQFAKGMTDEYRRLLVESSLNASKAVTLLAVFGKAMTAEERTALMQGVQSVNKTISANVSLVRGISADGLAALREKGGTVDKGVRTDTWIMRGVSNDGLLALRQANQTVYKNIKGSVDVGKLTAQQSTLLSAIVGTTSGTIKLGGGFSFDPSTAFKSWYETSTKSTITTPMDQLRSSLATLTAAVKAESARQDRASKEAAVGAISSGLKSTNDGRVYASEKQVWDMAKAAGIQTTTSDGKTPRPLWKVKADLVNFSDTDNLTDAGIVTDNTGSVYQKNALKEYMQPYKDAVAEARAKLIAVMDRWSVFYDEPKDIAIKSDGTIDHWDKSDLRKKNGGTIIRDYHDAYDGVYDSKEWDALWSANNALKAAIKSPPKFMNGGNFPGGGLAIVGEEGPEAVHLPAGSRINNTRNTVDMLAGLNDFTPLVNELKNMRNELAALMHVAADNARKSRDLLDKWDRTGMPKELI